MTASNGIIKGLGKAKKFKPQRCVKWLLSSNFCCDALHFIERFSYLYGIESVTNLLNHKCIRAKRLLELYFSIECSLKSLVISLSKDDETPSNAYKKARGKNHDLKKLFMECSDRAKNRVKFPKNPPSIFEDLSKLKIGIRYAQDIWLLKFNSDAKHIFLGEDIISKTIDNLEWEKNLQTNAEELQKLSELVLERFLKPYSMIMGTEMVSRDAELHKFVKELDNKKV